MFKKQEEQPPIPFNNAQDERESLRMQQQRSRSKLIKFVHNAGVRDVRDHPGLKFLIFSHFFSSELLNILTSPFPAKKNVIRTCFNVLLLHVHKICTRGKQQRYQFSLQRPLEEVLGVTKPSQYKELKTMNFRDSSLPPPNLQGKQLQMIWAFSS